MKEFVFDQNGSDVLNFNNDLQIFTGLLYERFDQLTIESKVKLEEGAFGEIYKVKIKELNSANSVMKTPKDRC